MPRGSVPGQWLDRLDLRIENDHGFLRLFDRNGLEFTTYGDERQYRLEAMREADLERFAVECERQTRIEAERRLAVERQARESAEAEVARLKALLEQRDR